MYESRLFCLVVVFYLSGLKNQEIIAMHSIVARQFIGVRPRAYLLDNRVSRSQGINIAAALIGAVIRALFPISPARARSDG